MKLIESSCVIVADQHNPSILNPDWLVKTEIINPDWELADPCVTTPVFARCSYVNKVQLILETNKLTVSSLPANGNDLSGELPRIIRKYVDTLTHIPYKQLGNNFRFSESMPDVLPRLKSKLIRKGNWDVNSISNIKTIFQYSVNDFKINLTIESSNVAQEGRTGTETALILGFNYHRDLKDFDSLISGIESWRNDHEDAVSRSGEIMKEMG